MRSKQLLVLFFLLAIIYACRDKIPHEPLINEGLVLSIGNISENRNRNPHIYKFIDQYYIDSEDRIYIGNSLDIKYDLYSRNGIYLGSIGRKGQGPGELQGITPFTVTGKHELITQSVDFSLTVFDSNGRYSHSISLPPPFDKSYIDKIKADYADRIYMLFFTRAGSTILQYENGQFKSFYVDPKRKSLDYSSASFLPILSIDFNFDPQNNVYVTDSCFYKITKCDPGGNIVYEYKRNQDLKKINKTDLVFFNGKEVVDLSNQFSIAYSALDKWGKCIPSVFGINIDKNKIYIWKSEQNSKKEYLIDIYDLNFKLLSHSAFYNYLPHNKAIIKKGCLYIPNLAPEESILNVGRFSYLEVPYRLDKYKLAK